MPRPSMPYRGRLPVLSAALSLAALAAALWIVRLNADLRSPVQSSGWPSATPWPMAADSDLPQLPSYSRAPGSNSIARLVEPLTVHPKRERLEVIRYTVQQGDSVFGIAEGFNLEPESLLWGNFDVLNDDPHMLRPGQELNILPVNGTYYQWKTGDTLESVAEGFGVDLEDLVDWPGNSLDPLDPEVQPGTWLVIPGGKRSFRQWFVPAIARGQAGVGSAYGPGGCGESYAGGAIGTGGFIWPSANHSVSGNDYWGGHLAIDVAGATGDLVWAADSGVVVFAGWSTVGYGYMIMIDHGTGWQTLYGHLSAVRVVCGESILQGSTIGAIGSTGNSTGSHLHFETRLDGGFVNPHFVLP
ncbi:MAG TPA: peptidoglycan DD-metalloendopeptidase family protein [Anaerolineales bacterium]|nr:peptidoglycan DD-metalloendopeptidase family protein [Anaerolineales bacterium]